MFYSVKSNVLLYERNTFDKSMYWSEGIKNNSPKHRVAFRGGLTHSFIRLYLI